MSYSPTELTPRDVIRGMAGDTAEPEWLTDETYDSILGRYGVPVVGWQSSPLFLRAGAEILRRVAVAIEQKPTSFTATGDMSVGWADRTRSLRALAEQLDGQADELEESESDFFGPRATVKNRFLTGSGVRDEW